MKPDRYTQHLRAQLAPVTVTGRWTPGRKIALLVLLKRGDLTLERACQRFGLSAEEIGSWRARDAAYGARGLCVTKLQEVGRHG